MKKFQNTDHTVLLLILNEKSFKYTKKKQISKLYLQQKPIFKDSYVINYPLLKGKLYNK